MMYFMINEEELSALCGLPHIQQLAYLRGIRPYMNTRTGIVGVERRISYQSIAEQLYVEPHQGIKSISFSRAQIRRALAGLERAGLIQFQSCDHQLILKCSLALQDYYAQKKAVTKPSQQEVRVKEQTIFENTEFSGGDVENADTADQEKAVIPYINNNYLFLYKHFETFWALYPNKKSQQKAWEEFQKLNSNEAHIEQIIRSLEAQIKNKEELHNASQWVPAWKYPANWLAQQCWNDELTPITTLEQRNATYAANSTKKSAIDVYSALCADVEFEFEEGPAASNNIVQFRTSKG